MRVFVRRGKGRNISAIIFWLKTRAHWREQSPEDARPPRADAEANSPVLLVVFPDNSRDAELTQALREAQEHYFAGKPMTRDSAQPGPIARQSEERAVLTEDALDAPADLALNLLQANPGQNASAPGM